jgi:hypothetical protein
MKKLFFLGTIDHEDGGYMGATLTFYIPDEITTYKDAAEYLKKELTTNLVTDYIKDKDYLENIYGEGLRFVEVKYEHLLVFIFADSKGEKVECCKDVDFIHLVDSNCP